MKKIYFIFVLLGLTQQGFAQYQTTELPQHEINLNIVNTLAIASAEVGYEYFLGFHQSVGAKILINDRMGYRKEKRGKEFNTHSFRINYTYYFGDYNPGSGLYVQPFLKYRFGNFKEEGAYASSGGNRIKTDMNALMVGVGLGYEWNFSNSFVMGPFINIARNFSDEVKERFSAIDYNAGFNIGYRF